MTSAAPPLPRTVIVPVEAPLRDQVRAALDDIGTSIRTRQSWLAASIRSVGNRYRRTILGPWWLTLTTIIFIFGLAVLRIGLGGGDLQEAVPYVGLGFIIFSLISGGITSGQNAYVSAGQQLSTSRAPYASYVLRENATQVIDFLHDALVILLLVLVFAIPLTADWALSVLAVVLIVIGSVGVGLWLGPLTARFRDLAPLVAAVMRLMFFLTPIFWSVDQLSATNQVWLAYWNPFTYQVLAFRDPILGTSHGWIPLAVTAGLALVNIVVGLIVFTWARPRIPYWVST